MSTIPLTAHVSQIEFGPIVVSVTALLQWPAAVGAHAAVVRWPIPTQDVGRNRAIANRET